MFKPGDIVRPSGHFNRWGITDNYFYMAHPSRQATVKSCDRKYSGYSEPDDRLTLVYEKNPNFINHYNCDGYDWPASCFELVNMSPLHKTIREIEANL